MKPKFPKVMEALTSSRALDEAINEGSHVSYKNLPKSSLPHSKKTHIYEGIDIHSITRDILSLPRSSYSKGLNNSRQYSVSMKLITQPPSEAEARSKKSSESAPVDPGFKVSAKYRQFIERKNKSDSFGRLPNLSPRSVEIPTNYNNFFSSEFERSRLQTSNGQKVCSNNGTPPVIRCSEDLKDYVPPETYPTIEKLILHIDDVKRMMGRKNGAGSKKVQKRNFSRKARSETLGLATRPTSVTPSQCKSLGFSRHKSVLDHYPELAVGRDILGFSRNWPREGIKRSVTPNDMMDSTLPLIDINPPR